MGFIDSIKEIIGIEEMPKEPLYRAVVFGEYAVHIENVLSIISYERQEVVLSVKKARLIIRGEDLFIKKYCEGDVVICGKIASLERVGV